MRPVFITAPPRKCNQCKKKETTKWYMDKTKGIGFLCNSCYRYNYFKKKGELLNKKKRDKRKLVKQHDNEKYCGRCGIFTVPDPVTNRCKNCNLKVRDKVRSSRRKKKLEMVARY